MAKTKRQVSRGKIYITATFNNTLVTVTDQKGNTLNWGSTGRVGFSGSRKSTPYAATSAIQKAIDEAQNNGLKQVEVFIKGPGAGRDAALRLLKNSRLKVTKISDVTPVPHNGTRARKERKG